MANDVRRVVEKITGVARAAADARAIVFGTVLSRNPDGSLNVDDGRGGCARVAAAANIRVGQKIALGVEPAIGTTTTLAVRYVTISPVAGCPIDPRDDPSHPPPEIGIPDNLLMTRESVQNHLAATNTWADRGTNWGTPGGGALPSTVEVGGIRCSADYEATGKMTCRRGFVEFPTSTVIPIGSTLESAYVEILPVGTGTTVSDTYSFDGNDLIIVPSVAGHIGLGGTNPDGTGLIAKVVIGASGTELGRVSIATLRANFGHLVRVDLNIERLSPYFNVGGATKLAFITEPDFNGVLPTQSTGTFHGDNVGIGDVGISDHTPHLVVGFSTPGPL